MKHLIKNRIVHFYDDNTQSHTCNIIIKEE